MRWLHITRFLALLFAAAAAPGQGTLQASPGSTSLTNHFQGIETWHFGNELQVHFKKLEGEPFIYFCFVVPVGSSMDPPELPGLAHFVEHAVIVQEINNLRSELFQELLANGGSINGSTHPTATRYYVKVPKSHWDVALAYMKSLLAAKRFQPKVVTRERTPISAEIRARSQGHDLSTVWRIENPFEQPLGANYYWKEFNVRLTGGGSYESLNRITVMDIQEHFEDHYLPSKISVLALGDLEPDRVYRELEGTLGKIQRPELGVYPTIHARNPKRFRRETAHSDMKFLMCEWRIRFYDYEAQDYLNWLYVQRFLQIELMRRLRWELQATYTPIVRLNTIADAGFLSLEGQFDADAIDLGMREMKKAALYLRDASYSPERFQEIHGLLQQEWLLEHQQPEAVQTLFVEEFYRRDVYDGIPDIPAHFSQVTQASIAEFLKGHMIWNNQNELIERKAPADRHLVYGVILAFLFALLAFFRRLWLKPMPASGILWQLKIRRHLSGAIAESLYCAAILGCSWAFLANLADLPEFDPQGYQGFYPPRLIACGFLLIPLTLLIIFCSRVPEKLFLFENGWRIQSALWRSLDFTYGEVKGVMVCSTFSVFWKILRKTNVKLTLWSYNPFRKGILILLKSDQAFFFNTDHNQDVVDSFVEMIAPKSDADYLPD